MNPMQIIKNYVAQGLTPEEKQLIQRKIKEMSQM